MAQANIPPTKIEPIYPPETIATLEVVKKLRVIEIKKRTGSPFFLATLFIPEMLWTTRINDLDEVLDNYVKYKAGNSTRVFLFPSSWDAKYNRWATDIFLRDDDGDFILPDPQYTDQPMGEFINPDWKNQVIARIQAVTSRKIMLIISLWDNCSTRYQFPGFWSENFLNPACNNVNTSDENQAYYSYLAYDSIPMRNTGKIVENLTWYMLSEIYDNLTPTERKYIAIETCNEGYSGTAWHMKMKEIIDETWGKACPRWRRFTSTQAEISTITRKHFTQVVHQIGSLDSYRKKIWGSDFIMRGISTDGWKEGDRHFPTPIPAERAIKLLRKTYKGGHVSFEVLHGHRNLDQRLPYSTYNTTENKKYYDHSGMRWLEMQEIAKVLLRLTK